MSKRLAGIFLFFVLLSSVVCAEEWKELKSEHFIVYYLDGDNFASDILQWSERYYDKIATDLGYSRYDNFWTWDKRVKIYIYRDRAEFLTATGAKNWSYGFANYATKEIVSYANNKRFLDALLPHELTHLIFRDYVGFKGEIPVWLDEGVAQWEEADKRKAAVELFKALVIVKETIPLQKLTRMDVAQEGNADISRKFYAESIALVGFLIGKYGESKFTIFCRQLRDGASINQALTSAYPDSMRDMGELEKEFIKYYGGG